MLQIFASTLMALLPKKQVHSSQGDLPEKMGDLDGKLILHIPNTAQ